MNILDESRTILEAAGYRTALAESSADVCYFEDESILGAVFVHSTVDLLLESWENQQDRFLGSHSGPLRNDPIKAWNIYTLHLTEETRTSAQATQLFNIEQDFRGTRKMVRSGVVRRADVKEALLPLLGLQHRLTLSRRNLIERLRHRLSLSGDAVVRLLDDAQDADIAAELMEKS